MYEWFVCVNIKTRDWTQSTLECIHPALQMYSRLAIIYWTFSLRTRWHLTLPPSSSVFLFSTLSVYLDFLLAPFSTLHGWLPYAALFHYSDHFKKNTVRIGKRTNHHPVYTLQAQFTHCFLIKWIYLSSFH